MSIKQIMSKRKLFQAESDDSNDEVDDDEGNDDEVDDDEGNDDENDDDGTDDENDDDNNDKNHDEDEESEPVHAKFKVNTFQEIITEAFNRLSMRDLIAVNITNIDIGQIVRQRFLLLLSEQIHPLEEVLSWYYTDPSVFQNIKLKLKVKDVTNLNDTAFRKSTLPEKITHLIIDDKKYESRVYLTQKMTELVFLKLSWGFMGSISGLSKMSNLKYFVSTSSWNFQELPSSLTHFSICPIYMSWKNRRTFRTYVPTGLTHLEVIGYASLDVLGPINRSHRNLTHLSLLSTDFGPMNNLPKSVTHFRLGDSRFHDQDYGETNITHLAIDEENLHNIVFPSSLSHLDILFRLPGNISDLASLVTHINSYILYIRNKTIIRYVLTGVVKVDRGGVDEEEILSILSVLLPDYVLTSSNLESWYNWPQIDGNLVTNFIHTA